MIALVLMALAVALLVFRRWMRRRAPRGAVSIDRYGPERAIFIREPQRRRRRYRA